MSKGLLIVPVEVTKSPIAVASGCGEFLGAAISMALLLAFVIYIAANDVVREIQERQMAKQEWEDTINNSHYNLGSDTNQAFDKSQFVLVKTGSPYLRTLGKISKLPGEDEWVTWPFLELETISGMAYSGGTLSVNYWEKRITGSIEGIRIDAVNLVSDYSLVNLGPPDLRAGCNSQSLLLWNNGNRVIFEYQTSGLCKGLMITNEGGVLFVEEYQKEYVIRYIKV